ncbi:MAG TPA: DUF3575 domain-containing protein [Chitinophagaceae bacterium]|nr:DUF3575 domain-containing protein [Chitinophagaceae bacterium]
MRNKVLFLFGLLLLAVSSSYSKSNNYLIKSNIKLNDSENLHHTVKLNLSSLPFSTISMQYEYLLGNKMSAALGIRYTPSSKIPFLNKIIDFTDLNEEMDAQDEINIKEILESSRLSGFAITPEFRFYLGKTGKGFYLAPFLRYEQNNFHAKTEYTTSYNDIGLASTAINFNSYGAGIMIGSQFKISRNVYLDWWILGPYFRNTQIKIDLEGKNIPEEDKTSFEESIEDFELGGFKPSIERQGDHIIAKGSINFWAIRGFGLNLAFRF